MAKPKYDGVVQAVHYKPDGQVEWVRAHLRRGKIFTDRVLLNRQALIEDLKAGKTYLVGERVPYLGATFQVSKPIRLINKNGNDILVTNGAETEKDRLEGVPVL